MKKKRFIFLILLLVFCVSGCNLEKRINSDDSITHYEKDELFEIAEETTRPVIAEQSSNCLSQESGGQSGRQDYLEQQENFEYIKYDAANCYYTTDVEKYMQSLFCLDKDTGVVYFINRNKDWYIYRLYNEKAELVVELPARNLYIVGGILYFIVEDYDKYELEEGLDGDIYAYSIAEGIVYKILETDSLEGEVYRMIPYEDGLALDSNKILKINADGSTTVKRTLSFYSFDSGNIETDSYKRTYMGWGDFYLQTIYIDGDWKIVLRNRINDEINTIEVQGTKGFIIENDWYSFDRQEIYVTNLLSGAQQVFNCLTMFQETAPYYASHLETDIHLINSVTVTRDYIWAVLLNRYLLCIDPGSGEAVCYMFAAEEDAINNLNSVGGICDLYTDGINVYAAYSCEEVTWNHGEMVYVNTEEIMGQHKFSCLPMLKLEYLTEER